METCPFCGKAFKRLKSHLPHCKVASAQSDSSTTEQTKKSPKTGTKRALLEAKAKEQNSENKGDDNVEITKKTKPVKNKSKHLESSSFRSQKKMLEEKEMVNLKTDIQKRNLDQAQVNSHLIDKAVDRFGYPLIEDPTAVAILDSPEASISLVGTNAVHVVVTQLQTAALQALPEGTESLKASQDILTWPSHKEEVRSTVEKMGSVSVKLPVYEEVSQVMEDGTEDENRCSFGNGFKGSFNMKHSQKHENQYLELPSEPSSSFLLPTKGSSSYRLENPFPRHSEHAQLPDISHKLQTCDSEELKSTKKSLEGQVQTWDSNGLMSTKKSLEGQLQTWDSNALMSMKKSLDGQLDLTPGKETKIYLPVRDVLSRHFSSGLQWIPDLHSNYILLKIVPEKMDLMSCNWRTGKSIAPGPANSEFSKPTQPQLIPEVPLTSRRLMDVRIGELSSWLALQRLSVKTIPELGQRAWTRYYNKYINVRKGGIGGLTMIVAGYCTLSYAWNYHHIRQDRWRKYH